MPEVQKKKRTGGPKRTRTERARAEEVIARFDSLKFSQEDIAAKLVEMGFTGVSRRTVSNDLKRIRQRARRTGVATRKGVLRGYQLRRRELYEGWLKSHQNAERTVQESCPESECGNCSGRGRVTSKRDENREVSCRKCEGTGVRGGILKVIKTVEGRLPDTRYMALILDTYKAERELLGLDEPRKVAVKHGGAVGVVQVSLTAEDLKPIADVQRVDEVGQDLQEALGQLPYGLKEIAQIPVSESGNGESHE